MNFEPFKRESVLPGVDGVTLRRDGSIYFPIAFQSRHNLGRYTSVELLTSDKTRQVALKPSTAAPSPTTARLIQRGKKNGREASAVSWVKLAASWGYPTGQSLGYETYDDGLIVLKKAAATASQDAKE